MNLASFGTDLVSTLLWVAFIAVALVVGFVVWRKYQGKSVPAKLEPIADNSTIQFLLDHLHKSIPVEQHTAAVAAAVAAATTPLAPAYVSSGAGVGLVSAGYVPPPLPMQATAAPRTDATIDPPPTDAPYVPNPLSNTPDWRRWTDVSPEGYPLLYGITTVNGEKVVDPRLPPRLYYDGQTFADVAEVRDYMVRAQQRANAGDGSTTVDVPGVGFPIFPPAVVATTLAVFDSAPSEGLRWFHLLAAEQFALQNRGMKRGDVNAQINNFNAGAPPEGWQGSAQQAYRG